MCHLVDKHVFIEASSRVSKYEIEVGITVFLECGSRCCAVVALRTVASAPNTACIIAVIHQQSTFIKAFDDSLRYLRNFLSWEFLYDFSKCYHKGVTLSSVQRTHGSDEHHSCSVLAFGEVIGTELVVLLYLIILFVLICGISLSIDTIFNMLAFASYHLIIRIPQERSQLGFWEILKQITLIFLCTFHILKAAIKQEEMIEDIVRSFVFWEIIQETYHRLLSQGEVL